MSNSSEAYLNSINVLNTDTIKIHIIV